jgi:glycosyltransferase involved in cell wall biosynthesis
MPVVLQEIDLQLVIAGEFWDDKQAYLDLIARLDLECALTIVDRYVPNEELGLYFAATDVVVLPYVSVTQSGIAQLAFGFGKPVITTCVGDLPQVVEHGRTGLIVPPADPDALSAALRQFFRTASVRVLGAGQMQNEVLAQRKQFSWARLEAIIDQVVQDVRDSGTEVPE